MAEHPNRTPLTILDLVPISSGSDASQALYDSIELARYAEDLGYARYWFAEHHLDPGVAGTSPAVVIALIAASTHRIRLGAGAVQLGHRTALSTVEEFGLIDALHPGRIDLGLGRTPPAEDDTIISTLLQLPGAHPQDHVEQVGDLLALLRGTYRSEKGVEAHVVPGERAQVEPWILGSGGGENARTAGAHGLRFAATHHLSPSTVVAAVEDYRAAFEPAADAYGVTAPYVGVSADVLVAEDEATARDLVAGRPHIQFVGTAKQVADRLEILREATGADELIVTTVTHDHGDRIRSFELLAEEWETR